ncbi:hypothetical protein [Devosia sp. DBB001]|nr:hypothetical protein [Devosia sp. DBB001]
MSKAGEARPPSGALSCAQALLAAATSRIAANILKSLEKT